jgi:hypothetical protein
MILSDSEIAQQAFSQFVSLLRGAGLLDARQHGA